MSRKHKRKKHYQKPSSAVKPDTPAPTTAEQPIKQPETPPAEPEVATPAIVELPAEEPAAKAPNEESLAKEEAAAQTPADEEAVQSETSTETVASATRRRASILWIVIAVLLLLIGFGGLLYFSGTLSPTLATIASQPMNQELAGAGLAMDHPAELTPLRVDNCIAATGNGFLARFEDVTEVYDAHLQAGYTPKEAAEALLSQGKELVTADGSVVDSELVLAENAAGSKCTVGFDVESSTLLGELELLSLDERLVLGILVVEDEQLADGQALYAAMRQTLRVQP